MGKVSWHVQDIKGVAQLGCVRKAGMGKRRRAGGGNKVAQEPVALAIGHRLIWVLQDRQVVKSGGDNGRQQELHHASSSPKPGWCHSLHHYSIPPSPSSVVQLLPLSN